jgi:hypothetical protein
VIQMQNRSTAVTMHAILGLTGRPLAGLPKEEPLLTVAITDFQTACK